MSSKMLSAKCRIEVICVGSELLYDRINTDVNILARILAERGLFISRCIIVGDDKKEIVDAVRSSLGRSEIIFVTGGLGPTSDDITKESIAELAGKKLFFSEEVWTKILKRFHDRNMRTIPEINRKQAYVIEGSDIMGNDAGTAPGFVVKKGKKKIVILPGPPVELMPMAERYAGTLRVRDKAGKLRIHRFGIAGISESAVEETVNPFLESFDTKYTILAHPQMIELLVTFGPGMKKIRETEEFFKQKFGDGYLGLDPPSLPEVIGNLLRDRKWKIAIAESCTGGLAGKLLTDIPGSSEFFSGSFVVYSNLLKKRVLKIPRSVLRKHGAVSEQTALYMAKGARKTGKADVSLSITGIAGPAGGSPEKPVGLVYIGVGMPKNRFYAYRFLFTGNRERIRERAVYQGFIQIRRHIIGEK